MNIKDFFFTKQSAPITPIQAPAQEMMQFSTPFGRIGEGNLSLPYIRAYSHTEPYIRFGSDNLFPQLINQMYYTSPLNSGIINFKVNAVIGGGFELKTNNTTARSKVDEYTFMKLNKFQKLSKQLTQDLIMHNRVYVKMCKLPNGRISYHRIAPEKVRTNYHKTFYTISDDWARSIDIHQLLPYTPDFECECLYAYECETAGQDIYPIPSYCSSLNWSFVDGEMAYLQKSNIINSIFPSFMITMATKFKSQEEAQAFKDVINKAKGAQESGRVLAFVSEFSENLPSVTALPQNNNDKLFIETITNLEANICRSHSIDPLILGIRVSGKLGSGNELAQSYTIFEKNVVHPLRDEMEEILNDLLYIGGINSVLEINDYQIIDNEITEVKKY